MTFTTIYTDSQTSIHSQLEMLVKWLEANSAEVLGFGAGEYWWRSWVNLQVNKYYCRYHDVVVVVVVVVVYLENMWFPCACSWVLYHHYHSTYWLRCMFSSSSLRVCKNTTVAFVCLHQSVSISQENNPISFLPLFLNVMISIHRSWAISKPIFLPKKGRFIFRMYAWKIHWGMQCNKSESCSFYCFIL